MRNPDENRLQLAVDWLDGFDAPPVNDVEDVKDQDYDPGLGSELPPRSLPAPSSRARLLRHHCSGELVRSSVRSWIGWCRFGSGQSPYRLWISAGEHGTDARRSQIGAARATRVTLCFLPMEPRGTR